LALVERAKEFYDAVSDSYDELYGEEQSLKYLGALKRLSLNEKRVLDAGAGSLLFEKLLLRLRGGTPMLVVALELSRALDRSYQDLKSLAWLDPVRGDIFHMPLRERAFDLVLSFTVLGGYGSLVLCALEGFEGVCRDGCEIVASLHKKTVGAGEMAALSKFCEDFWQIGSDLACYKRTRY